MSSGYLAGQLVCDYLSDTDQQLYYAPNIHSVLFRSQQKVYASWIELKNDIKKNQRKNHVVFLDSIDFNGFNYPEFKKLQELPLKHITLVVNDSHGIGITGDNGGGNFKNLQSLKPK